MLAQKCKLEIKSVSSLLDGRVFYIPSYQRGYRWNSDEVEALLDDLLVFAIRNRRTDHFYCLQPIVVKQIVDEDTISKLRSDLHRTALTTELEPEEEKQQVLNTEFQINNRAWEVIDGQQRLTTLHILFNYLMDEEGFCPERLLKRNQMVSYTIEYQTRPHSAEFLNSLSGDTKASDIDSYFMLDAYNTIQKWCYEKAPIKYPLKVADVEDYLWGLFNDSKPDEPTIKVIWYEIDSQRTDTIDEFLNLNTGKIGLTNAELVKALFLQDRGDRYSSQINQIAIEWENIENTLSKDSFWTFLSNEITEKSSRIEFLLHLYMSVDAEKKKIVIDTSKKNYLFNYYNDLFESFRYGGDTIVNIQKLWNSIIEVFRNLESWFEDPILYNFIGYLSQCKVTVKDIYNAFTDVNVSTKQDFIKKLRGLINRTLSYCRIDSNTHLISNKYGEQVIRRCLLLLNIDYLNSQLFSLQEEGSGNHDYMSPAFKFPFDLYLSQHWNVEHIDSATTNAMKDKETKKTWIETALADLGLKEEENYQSMLENEDYDNLINELKQKAGEEEDDDKMEIGNLTLLDEKTNKSYGNSLFVTKRKIIFDNILKGSFVPACTQLIFSKTFETTGSSLTKWTKSDKQNYANFITERLKKYIENE